MPDSLIDASRLEEISLDSQESLRYARHLTLPEVGPEGQRRLKAASVLCVGAGGLGSPIALYLAAAGVGKIGIVDADVVDESNLQRQLLHGTADVGRKKIDSAHDRLQDINPHVEVIGHDALFTSANAMELAAPYDLLIDGTDNFPTRYLSNDVAVFLKKPNVYGSIFRFEGQATVFAPHLDGPCYRCLFPEPPEPGMVPSCAEGGVLGVLPGIVGTLQAIEAVKLILGVGESLLGRLLHFDALAMRFRQFNLRRDPQCPVCGDAPTITEPIDYQQFCGLPGEHDNAPADEVPTISVQELQRRLAETTKPFTLLDVRESFEHDICNLPDAKLIPLGELPDRVDELDSKAEILVHCKVGGRSLEAVKFLRSNGFENVTNVAGGINAWSKEVDESVAYY